jgi:hypothetical protein
LYAHVVAAGPRSADDDFTYRAEQLKKRVRDRTDLLDQPFLETGLDQVPYVGNAYNLYQVAQFASERKPAQALVNLAKVPNRVKFVGDAILNHLEPAAEAFDTKHGTPAIDRALKALQDPALKRKGLQVIKGKAKPMHKHGGAVILGGLSHEQEGRLGKGNPIVHNGEKVAETESEELLLSKVQTDRILKQVKAATGKGRDKALVKLGKEMQKILLTETVDNRG